MTRSGVEGESDIPRLTSTGAQATLARDLRVAELVHRSMIPTDHRRGQLEVVCDFRPSIGIGGDYASVHFQDDQHIVVGICDVSGHGVASALLANRVNSFVLSQAPHVHHPCQLVEALNDFVFHTFHDTELYLTFFSLFIDLHQHTLVGAGCGHPPVLHVRQQAQRIDRLVSGNQPVGLFEHLSQSCSMLKTPFLPGDRLVLYTDGITESTAPDGSDLGVSGLERYVAAFAHRPLGDFAAAIRQRVERFRWGRAADDDELLLTIAHLASDGTDPATKTRRDDAPPRRGDE